MFHIKIEFLFPYPPPSPRPLSHLPRHLHAEYRAYLQSHPLADFTSLHDLWTLPSAPSTFTSTSFPSSSASQSLSLQSSSDLDYRFSPLSLDYVSNPTLQSAAEHIAGLDYRLTRSDFGASEGAVVGMRVPSPSITRCPPNTSKSKNIKGSDSMTKGKGKGKTSTFNENVDFSEESQDVKVEMKGNKETRTGTLDLPWGLVRLFREKSSHISKYSSTSATISNGGAEGMRRERSWSSATLQDGGVVDEEDEKEEEISETDVVAVLAVPSYMTTSDFLIFVGRKVVETLKEVRMIRDNMPNRCIALLKFTSPTSALHFVKSFNGKPFTTGNIDSETCHAIPVKTITLSTVTTPPYSTSTSIFSTSPSLSHLNNVEEIEGGIAALNNTYEVPTCPTCLERLDASVTGIQPPPCRHGPSCTCLSRWGTSTCPICRFSSQTSNGYTSEEELSCSSCQLSENLWICLICGHVGCGRYQARHAQGHFGREGHAFAMEVRPGTGRVWDYGSDGYVHRLVRSGAEGKVVELPSSSNHHAVGDSGGGGPDRRMMESQEKIEAIGLEYSYLLSSQLERQREFYEEKIKDLRKMLEEERREREGERRRRKEVEEMWERESKEKEEEEKEKKSLDKGIKDKERDKWTKELKKEKERSERFLKDKQNLEKKLEEESLVIKGMMENLDKARMEKDRLEAERKEKEKEVEELKEQVRDVMVALEMRERIEREVEKGEQGEQGVRELEGGDVFVAEVGGSGKKGKKKKR